MKKFDPDSVEKHVSVNKILLKLTKTPMKMEEFTSIEHYFNALRDAFLIDIIGTSHYYNKDVYDFYFIIEDTSKNWAKKLILKKSMVDLILKYRVIEYLIVKYYKDHTTPKILVTQE